MLSQLIRVSQATGEREREARERLKSRKTSLYSPCLSTIQTRAHYWGRAEAEKLSESGLLDRLRKEKRSLLNWKVAGIVSIVFLGAGLSFLFGISGGRHPWAVIALGAAGVEPFTMVAEEAGIVHRCQCPPWTH